jgi:hypothetical protein
MPTPPYGPTDRDFVTMEVTGSVFYIRPLFKVASDFDGSYGTRSLNTRGLSYNVRFTKV